MYGGAPRTMSAGIVGTVGLADGYPGSRYAVGTAEMHGVLYVGDTSKQRNIGLRLAQSMALAHVPSYFAESRTWAGVGNLQFDVWTSRLRVTSGGTQRILGFGLGYVGRSFGDRYTPNFVVGTAETTFVSWSVRMLVDVTAIREKSEIQFLWALGGGPGYHTLQDFNDRAPVATVLQVWAGSHALLSGTYKPLTWLGLQAGFYSETFHPGVFAAIPIRVNGLGITLGASSLAFPLPAFDPRLEIKYEF